MVLRRIGAAYKCDDSRLMFLASTSSRYRCQPKLSIESPARRLYHRGRPSKCANSAAGAACYLLLTRTLYDEPV